MFGKKETVAGGRRGLTRRQLLQGLGAGGAAAVAAGAMVGAAGCSGGQSAEQLEESSNGEVVANVERMKVDFRGERQSGMYEAQQSLQMCSVDVLDGTTREDLIQLFKDWTKAAENMMLGYPVNEPSADKNLAPDDTGEAYDLGAAGLTITFGVGASLFETAKGKDRFGLKSIKPANLVHEMRKFPGDNLNASECGGDISIKCAAEDPQVAWHAAHNLLRIGYGKTRLRWNKTGFIRTYSPEGLAHAPRDPFGFRDGTSNPVPAEGDEQNEQDLIEKCVWIHADDPEGKVFENGTYMCWRSFAGKIEAWDDQRLEHQEQVIGRTKLEGIPLSGGEDETAEPDLSATDADGNPLIPADSHVATLRAVRNETGHVMFRWGWNWANGLDGQGNIAAGMHTGGYARDPEADFYKFLDAFRYAQLTDYFEYTGSALFLILPGIKQGDEYIGQGMFEATA